MQVQDVYAISSLNDAVRKSIPFVPKPHRFVVTRRVLSLPVETRFELISMLRTYNDFTHINDPYGEHDFGEIKLNGTKFFWKIDYYDSSFQFYQENGVRVITLMLAEEY